MEEEGGERDHLVHLQPASLYHHLTSPFFFFFLIGFTCEHSKACTADIVSHVTYGQMN